MTSEANRYAGKPFLKLLECYVLDVIDQLDDARRVGLQFMEPKLREVYGMTGTWADIVAAQMEFSESFREQVRTIWDRYLEHARKQGQSVHPGEFVLQFVDESFPDISKGAIN